MRLMLCAMALIGVSLGCKPGEKEDPKSYTPTGYSNGAVRPPPQAVIDSNNIYTRGDENKTAGAPGSDLKRVDRPSNSGPATNP